METAQELIDSIKSEKIDWKKLNLLVEKDIRLDIIEFKHKEMI